MFKCFRCYQNGGVCAKHLEEFDIILHPQMPENVAVVPEANPEERRTISDESPAIYDESPAIKDEPSANVDEALAVDDESSAINVESAAFGAQKVIDQQNLESSKYLPDLDPRNADLSRCSRMGTNFAVWPFANGPVRKLTRLQAIVRTRATVFTYSPIDDSIRTWLLSFGMQLCGTAYLWKNNAATLMHMYKAVGPTGVEIMFGISDPEEKGREMNAIPVKKQQLPNK
uniref:Uncharacterized protein n=1 Tax=Panagrolaimus sp. JU765 TaxID=591449 RepID=A0AC34QV68_9BILA